MVVSRGGWGGSNYFCKFLQQQGSLPRFRQDLRKSLWKHSELKSTFCTIHRLQKYLCTRSDLDIAMDYVDCLTWFMKYMRLNNLRTCDLVSVRDTLSSYMHECITFPSPPGAGDHWTLPLQFNHHIGQFQNLCCILVSPSLKIHGQYRIRLLTVGQLILLFSFV